MNLLTMFQSKKRAAQRSEEGPGDHPPVRGAGAKPLHSEGKWSLPIAPDYVRRMRAGGWVFEWDEHCQFIGARHPRGGRQSVLEIKRPEFFPLGPIIAAMMNGGGEDEA